MPATNEPAVADETTVADESTATDKTTATDKAMTTVTRREAGVTTAAPRIRLAEWDHEDRRNSHDEREHS